ncbi:RHS repeat domain-containing protein [Victivallis sp. Marseille-Q1083]|uniref:RHS repeat domain-containing protein n=1 Tax=Victivallis sp. Marseille-Q1083 TaxID=2717288 RepID=UPI001588FE74|nr:RHS repeat-associated core domain-containing protein [Victivallis sp. Marseille-Q1083]
MKYIQNSLNQKVYFLYNNMKQLPKIWGDLLYPTEFIYSNSGQLIQRKTYRTGTNWNNSSDGKLLTRTWARVNAGQPLTTTYGYDIFGQLHKIDYSDSTPDITYTYNRLGQPLTVVDTTGTRTFTYNVQFALQKELISGIYTKELNRVYTTSGLKGSYSGLNIGTVNLYTYGYDQYSRLNKVTTAAGVFNYTFLANSDLIASMTRPNNVPTNYTYETARDLLTKVANGAISTFQYNNDALGRRTSMNRSGSAFTAADVLSYTYNSYSELTGASSNNNASYSYSYTYDPIGNRKTAGLAGTNWTYTANSLNQYSALNQAGTVQNPTYDTDGNMLTRDGWTQTWNAENRLVKAEKGTAKLEFAYDYMGRRIEKKVYNGNTLTSHIRFIYDGYKLIEELNGLNNNAVLRRYVWQPVMLDAPLTVFDAAANKTYFYHTDANKNVTDLTDSAGTIVAHYEYSPFGQLVKSSGAYANTNVLTWSSEYTDRETGLVYYNFREYDPVLGRWISKDPINEYGGLNLYAMLKNSITSNIDLLGLIQCCGETFIDPVVSCCENNQPVDKVIDDAGRQCCPNEIGTVTIHIMPLGISLSAWTGHAWIQTPTQFAGFHPSKGGLGQIHSVGKVKDDSIRTNRDGSLRFISYPANSYEYRACPATYELVDEAINNTRTNPTDFSYDNSFLGGRNCTGQACYWIDYSGLTAPFDPDTRGLWPGAPGVREYGPGREPKPILYFRNHK